jgi:WD40 repeat protein
LHSEPHMSHIHRCIINDKKRCEPLLNLYGKIRKGIEVPADLGSALQRRLMAIGLLVIDEDSNLVVRNRLYELVFTARWANENLPTHFKVPAIVAGILLLFAMIPFWYTQWLPNPYVRTLISTEVELPEALAAYENFRSFPGHADTAENLYRSFLEGRAAASNDVSEIRQLAELVAHLPNAGRLPEEFEAGFWDRKSKLAVRQEDRDTALLANIQSLVLATTLRRQRAASLLSDDYPLLLATLPSILAGTAVFDPAGMVLTAVNGASISQYSFSPQGLQQREPWSVTALEVSPLVRRVIVDRQGIVSRIGLTLNVSHARLADLRIKIIAPSGRTIEIETGLERASSNDDIRIPVQQLQDLIGESLSGTWSISVRDESLGVAGQLVGWNLKLNSQGAVEYFQRGLNIPDPVERETDDIWFDPSGRYAVARAMQSDSARLWDLAFAEPIRAIALPEGEVLIGLDASARRLVTATQDRVNLWDTASGDRIATFTIGAANAKAVLTPDRSHLFVERRGDAESRLELWNLDDGTISAEVLVPGVPALVAIDASGSRVAIADFDRAVRVWDFNTSELIGQFDLPAQPGAISLSSDGSTMGAVYPNVGLSVFDVANPQRPLLEEFGDGQWQLTFSPSGNIVAAGRPETGFRVFNSKDGGLIGPALGVRRPGQSEDLLAFSQDEQLLLTGSPSGNPRIWRVPAAVVESSTVQQSLAHTIWTPAADGKLVAAPDGSFVVIGDQSGHVHVVASGATLAEIALISDDVSFVGHNSDVRLLTIAPSGTLAASVADDNTLRVWRTGNGEPLAYVVEVSGPPVSHIEFSPGAEYVGVLSGSRVSIIDVIDGTMVAEYDSSSVLNGLTFASENKLYMGSENGALQLLSQSVDGNWNVQQVWQGADGIRLLRASPRGDFLILVDQNNLASQFMLSEGRIGDATLLLPSNVQEVAFDNNGSRAYFRTPRWVHRVSSSMSGLIWMDALFVPRPLNGAGIVHGNGSPDSGAGHRMYLPVARNDYIELLELSLSGSTSTGLFGNKDDLLKDWRDRINAAPLEGS